MAQDRTCFMCGTKYSYCPTCKTPDAGKPWKFLYHDERCEAISKIWYAYRGHEISKEEAKRQLDKYPENIELILKNDSVPANEIKEIYDIHEEKQAEEKHTEEKPVEEEAIKEVVEVEKHDDKEVSKPEKSNGYKGNKNNKK